jgi:hypothetical protein
MLFNGTEQNLLCDWVFYTFHHTDGSVVSVGKALVCSFPHERPGVLFKVPFAFNDLLVILLQAFCDLHLTHRLLRATHIELSFGFRKTPSVLDSDHLELEIDGVHGGRLPLEHIGATTSDVNVLPPCRLEDEAINFMAHGFGERAFGLKKGFGLRNVPEWFYPDGERLLGLVQQPFPHGVMTRAHDLFFDANQSRVERTFANVFT